MIKFINELSIINFNGLKHPNVSHIDLTVIFISYLMHLHPHITENNIARYLVDSGLNGFNDYLSEHEPSTSIQRNPKKS